MNSTDIFSDVPDQRRELMARVRGTDSRPEMLVRRATHALGFRYRLHDRRLPGTPDLVFPRFKKVIFVHGCFWHRHVGCSRTTTPKTRTDYWEKKFADNVQRDCVNQAKLEALGWEVHIVWECQTKDLDLVERISRFFSVQST
jgi:DNA mismatch endonuclease, patch repair protein